MQSFCIFTGSTISLSLTKSLGYGLFKTIAMIIPKNRIVPIITSKSVFLVVVSNMFTNFGINHKHKRPIVVPAKTSWGVCTPRKFLLNIVVRPKIIAIIEIQCFLIFHIHTARDPYVQTENTECPLGNEYPVDLFIASPAGTILGSLIHGR